MKPHRMYQLLLLAVILLGACNPASSGVGLATANLASEATKSPSREATVESVPSSDPSVRLVDALGREVILPAPPAKISIAGRATALLAHTLYLFPEAKERLATLEVRLQRDRSFYPLVAPHFDEVEGLERNAGPEQIAPLHPDVVLLKSYMAESLGDPIEAIGIPVVYVDLETPEEFFRDIGILGQLLGNEARAQEIIAFYLDRLDRLDALVESVRTAEAPKVLLLQYSEGGGEVALQVPGASWIQTAMVRRAGGDPVWVQAAEGGGWIIVGFEQIAAWNPDQIFVIYYPEDPTPIVEQLRKDPKWQALKAVQNGELYGFAGDFLSWDQPDPRWILGLTWLAVRINPEIAQEIDLRQEVIRFYHELYDLDPDVIEGEILSILQMGGD